MQKKRRRRLRVKNPCRFILACFILLLVLGSAGYAAISTDVSSPVLIESVSAAQAQTLSPASVSLRMLTPSTAAEPARTPTPTPVFTQILTLEPAPIPELAMDAEAEQALKQKAAAMNVVPESTFTPEPALTIEPASTPEPTSMPEPELELKSLGTFTLTAYCACVKCCGKWSEEHPSRVGTKYVHKTASGTTLTAGRTIAVDPNVIPFGAKVVIDGHEYTAEDTGSAIKGNRIDIFFKSHEKASDFRRQKAEVFISAEN